MEIELVGITNPSKTDALTYKLWVMDTGGSNKDERVKEAYSVSNTLAGKPGVAFDLFTVTVADRALRAEDTYRFYFDIEGSTDSYTLKHMTTKFVVFFPDDYSVQPATTASSVKNEQRVGDCNLYEKDYMSGTDMNLNDYAVYSSDVPTCVYNYLHHWLGNAVEFSLPNKTEDDKDTVLQKVNGTDTTDYLEYVLQLKVSNADNAYERDDDESYDFVEKDIWGDYKFYTRKFYLAAYEDDLTDCASQVCARGYGVLNSNWVGLNDFPKVLYVLNEEGKVISEKNPIYVNSGQQSGDYYVTTGDDWDKTNAKGLTTDFVRFSAGDDWVEFGVNGTENEIKRNDNNVAFRVRAAMADAGSIKYINWNPIEQPDVGEKEYVSTMQQTKVQIYDTVKRGLEGSVTLSTDTLEAIPGKTALPITVAVDPSCNKDLKVKITVDMQGTNAEGESLNAAETVTVTPDTIEFVAWSESDEFEVSISEDWD